MVAAPKNRSIRQLATSLLRAYWSGLTDGSMFRPRQYAAAKSGGAIGNWIPVSQNVNVEIATSRQTVNARVRQLVRDMPHASRALSALTKFTIGSGLVLQPRVVDETNGKLNKTLNRKIEDAWKFWGDEADLSGRQHLYDLMSTLKRQEGEIGESVLIRSATSAPGRFLPFALRPIEADRIASTFTGPALPGNEIYDGVEFDPRTGQTRRYWFDDESTVGVLSWGAASTRVIALPAARVLHTFETLRPGQLRGISPFAPAVLLAQGLRDYLEAEIDGAKMAARWLAFVKSPDPASTMTAFGAKVDTTQTTRKIEEIGTAITQYLLPNEDVSFAAHDRPGDAFTPFTRFCLRTFAILLDLSYELVSGDYEGLNYSVLRGSRNDLAQQLMVHRARFVRQVCTPIYREFLNWCVLAGKLDLPRYFDNPWPYLRCVWLGPGLLPVDPLKEGRADLDAIGGLLKSPQESILERGRDPEEVLDELAEWNQLVEDRGLEPEEPEQPMQSNPAALDDQDEGEEPSRKFRRVK